MEHDLGEVWIRDEQSGEEEESLGQPVMCWKGENALALLQACEKA